MLEPGSASWRAQTQGAEVRTYVLPPFASLTFPAPSWDVNTYSGSYSTASVLGRCALHPRPHTLVRELLWRWVSVGVWHVVSSQPAWREDVRTMREGADILRREHA